MQGQGTLAVLSLSLGKKSDFWGSQGPRGGPESCKSEFFEYSFGSPSGRNFISKSGRFQARFSFRLDKSDSSDVLKPRVLSEFRKILHLGP